MNNIGSHPQKYIKKKIRILMNTRVNILGESKLMHNILIIKHEIDDMIRF